MIQTKATHGEYGGYEVIHFWMMVYRTEVNQRSAVIGRQ